MKKDVLTDTRKDSLPQWKFGQNNGDPLQLHEWIEQFRSVVDSQNLSDDVKLKRLKTLVIGKVKSASAHFAYSGAMYKDALVKLERNVTTRPCISG